MKTLILGANGQLGRSLLATADSDSEVLGLDLPELDITDAAAVQSICRDTKPDVIINTAAYTAVDQAESNVDDAVAINVEGPRNIALAARESGSRLIHLSTDFVFDGKAAVPYPPDAVANPVSVYGRTKRDGELAVLEAMPTNAAVVRTAWLYSREGGNFVKTMLRLMAERDQISVVADQRGTPTWAVSLAAAVWALSRQDDMAGIYHWTDAGETTWHGFAVAIEEEARALGLLQRSVEVLPIASSEYPTAATRPAYSVLDCSTMRAATGLPSLPWRDNLREMLEGMID